MDPGLLRDGLTVLLGLLTGVMSGLFGVGGAVISTPGIRALGAPALLAIGSTLPAIIPGAASGTARYARDNLVDWKVVSLTAPFGIVAAVLGALLAKHVPGDGHLLMLFTAALLGFSALRMLPTPASGSDASPDQSPDDQTSLRHQPAPRAGSPTRFALVGVLAGTLSGLLGIGGGIVMVPGFTQFAKLPVKTAIGTSLACVGLFAIPGTITHALLGNIDWRFALLLCVGIIPGARLGAALAIRAGDRRLRLVVATFLGLMAIAYGAGETIALLG